MNESITRALSGIVYILLLLSATLFDPWTFIILFGIFMIIAVWEFCKLVKLSVTAPIIMALAGFILFGIYINNDFYTNLLLNVACLVISLSLLGELFSTKAIVPKDDMAKQARLIGYVIIPFLLIIKLPFLNLEHVYNPYIVIGMFILIWANDTFAYIVGKAIGRRKLFERISPKKTIEGFLGGMLFTIISAYFLGSSKYFTILTPLQWMAFAAILVVFGTLGDLVESKLKRTAGVKDSGKIMPGHGGILDRLDSILFAIPFIFLYYQILHYVS